MRTTTDRRRRWVLAAIVVAVSLLAGGGIVGYAAYRDHQKQVAARNAQAATERAAAQAAAEAYASAQHRLGKDITISGIHAALHQPGVARVDLSSPAANIAISDEQAGYCTEIDLTDGGIL